jgi:hypothetical protein
MMACSGNRSIISLFLNHKLDGEKRLTSLSGGFTLEKEARCPLNRRLGRPQIRSGSSGKQKISFLKGHEIQIVSPIEKRSSFITTS